MKTKGRLMCFDSRLRSPFSEFNVLTSLQEYLFFLLVFFFNLSESRKVLTPPSTFLLVVFSFFFFRLDQLLYIM